MSRWNLAWLAGVPAAVLLGLAVSASAPPPDQDYKLVRTVVDVLAEVDRHYVKPLDDAAKRRLVEDMINGGLGRLDPHSQYFNAGELEQFEADSEGQFGGVGILMAPDPKTGLLRVESPMPGTPAYDAGLQAGDLIAQVDGKPTDGMAMDDARRLIKGPPGTAVTLAVLPAAGRPREVVLTRAVIEVHPVMGYRRRADDPARWDFLADPRDHIALVRVTQFNDKTTREVKAAVDAAEAAGARGLVLDLRDNPGGLLKEAVAVADLFVRDGRLVGTTDRDKAERWFEAAAAGGAFEPAADRPMAVLVNRNSASAAEIVAAALQDHKRAAVVGERTYGKGSVQKVFPLSVAGAAAGAVKLTSEVWLTPAGKNIHRWPDSTPADEWGVRPDAGLEVPLTDADRRAYLAHMRSLDLVRGKPGLSVGPPPGVPPNPAAPAAAQTPYTDPVVEKALDHLRGKLKGVGAVGPRRWRGAA